MKKLLRATLFPLGILIGLYAALVLDPRIMLTLAAAAVVEIIVNAYAEES